MKCQHRSKGKYHPLIVNFGKHMNPKSDSLLESNVIMVWQEEVTSVLHPDTTSSKSSWWATAHCLTSFWRNEEAARAPVLTSLLVLFEYHHRRCWVGRDLSGMKRNCPQTTRSTTKNQHCQAWMHGKQDRFRPEILRWFPWRLGLEFQRAFKRRRTERETNKL